MHSALASLALAVALSFGGVALAQTTPAAAPSTTPKAASPAKPAARNGGSTGVEASIKALLEKKFPGATISDISKSPYANLYEVHFDDQLVYTDANVSYVFVGSIYDAESKRNLSDERLRRLNRIAWNDLPFDLAMKKVKGNGERKIAVFADADCPFCSRLENELKNIDNVTIYTFVYPIDSLHPDAARKTRVIWCAPDRVAAWDAWFASRTLPDNTGDCDTPLEKTLALGRKLHVNATPTLVFADGTLVPGALPAERLESEMARAQAELAGGTGNPKPSKDKAAARSGG